MANADHSVLAPSSAHRWVECPGSVMAELAAPVEPESTAASDGTLTHDLGAHLIDYACRNLFPQVWQDVKAPGPAYTSDMIQAAYEYALEVWRVLHTFKILGGPHMGVEDKLNINSIHEVMFGTTDAWVYSRDSDTLVIWDLKYGFGVVEPFENWQLACYFAGVDQRIGPLNPDTKVQFRIYQPRAPHPQGIRRIWHTTVNELGPMLNRLRISARNALSDQPYTEPGAHCRYCRARYACTALERSALEAAEYLGTPTPNELDGQGLAVELAILEHAQSQLGYRLTAIQEQAYRMIRAGKQVPGYRMTEGRGSVAWKLPLDDVAALAASVGVDVRKGLMTPKQAREAGMTTALVDACSERRPGKLSVKADDGSLARMIFGGNYDG